MGDENFKFKVVEVCKEAFFEGEGRLLVTFPHEKKEFSNRFELDGIKFLGSVLGFKVFEMIGWTSFPTNGLFVDSIGAFIILVILIWIQRTNNGYIEN